MTMLKNIGRPLNASKTINFVELANISKEGPNTLNLRMLEA